MGNYKLKIIIFCIVLPLYAQTNQSHSLVLGFLQIKDQFNLGMVFDGPQFEYRYGITWEIDGDEIQYQPKLAFGEGSSHDIAGYQVRIVPINFSWIRSFFEGFKGGLNLVNDYSYQMYPDLQGSHLFWASEIGISPVVKYNYQWENKGIEISLQNSLFGFTSHTQENEPYFYSFAVKDFFAKPHEDLKFGSFNSYNHTNISFEYIPTIPKVHSFSYELDYFGLYYGKRFSRLSHNLFWKITL